MRRLHIHRSSRRARGTKAYQICRCTAWRWGPGFNWQPEVVLKHESLDQARAWIYDCFEDAPADLDDLEVIEAINLHFIGGWEAFVIDGY